MLLAVQDDDIDFANRLAERGYIELSKDVLEGIKKNPKSTSQQKEAIFGLLRLKIIEAAMEGDPKKKIKLAQDAVKGLEGYTERGDQGLKGRVELAKAYQILGQAQSEDKKSKEAKEILTKARNLFNQLIKDLNSLSKIEEKKGYIYEAMYGYIVSTCHLVDSMKDDVKNINEMTKLINEVITYYNDDMGLEGYGDYLGNYDMFIYIGKAYAAVAKGYGTDRAHSANVKKYYQEAFGWITKIVSRLPDAQFRATQGVRGIVSNAAYNVLSLRSEYAEYLGDPSGRSQYQSAVDDINAIITFYQDFLKDFNNVTIVLDLAKALFKTKNEKNIMRGKEFLDELIKTYPKTWIELKALELLGDYAAKHMPVEPAMRLALQTFEQGIEHHPQALSMYKSCLASIKTPKEYNDFAGECWSKIAQCYFWMKRHFEQIEASEIYLEKFPNHTDRKDIIKQTYSSLEDIKKLVKTNKELREEYEKKLKDFIRAHGEHLGPSIARNAAVTEQNSGNFKKAAEAWQMLLDNKEFKDKPEYKEFILEALAGKANSLYRYALNLYKDKDTKKSEAEFVKARAALKEYLKTIMAQPKFKQEQINDVTEAAFNLCRIVHKYLKWQKKEELEELLAETKRILDRIAKDTKDPKQKLKANLTHIAFIMGERIRALVELEKTDEAQKQLKELRNAIAGKETKEREETLHYSIYMIKDHIDLLADKISLKMAKITENVKSKLDKITDKNSEEYKKLEVEYNKLVASGEYKSLEVEFARLVDKSTEYDKELLSGAISGDPKERLNSTHRLFEIAERKKTDVKLYKRARELYESVSEESIPEKERLAVRFREIICLEREGDYEAPNDTTKALKAYEEALQRIIIQSQTHKTERVLFFKKPKILIKISAVLRKSGKVEEAKKKEAEAIDLYVKAILSNEDTRGSLFYELLYEYLDVVEDLEGYTDHLRKLIISYEKLGYYPDFDNDPEWKEKMKLKFDELRDKLKIVPKE